MPYTDEQIYSIASRYADEAPPLDYSRPGIFASEAGFLMAFGAREARILQAYSASHGTTPNKLIDSFISKLAAEG
jgi:hypothetical protein